MGQRVELTIPGESALICVLFVADSDLDKAILTTSELIGSDWSKLYIELMTYVSRGQKTTERDIRDMVTDLYRGSHQVQAVEAMRRWRRLHVLANLGHLKKALQNINRRDVIQKLEEKPSKPEPVKQIRKRTPSPVNFDEAQEAASRFMHQYGPLRLYRSRKLNPVVNGKTVPLPIIQKSSTQ